MSEWVEIVWGLTKFYFKQMLTSSAFYLKKQQQQDRRYSDPKARNGWKIENLSKNLSSKKIFVKNVSQQFVKKFVERVIKEVVKKFL